MSKLKKKNNIVKGIKAKLVGWQRVDIEWNKYYQCSDGYYSLMESIQLIPEEKLLSL